MKHDTMRKFFTAVIFALCASLLLAPSRGGAAPKRGKISSASSTPKTEEIHSAPLPKQGTFAVLVKGPDPQHDAATAAIVSQRLIAKGYKVVDKNRLAQIRASRAADAALMGDVDAVMRISKQYGVGTTITINASVDGEPRRNEFDLFTGTASVAVTVLSSGGKILYADTIAGRQVGYTRGEADRKAVEAAATEAVERMTR